jgi:hypothetical protein
MSSGSGAVQLGHAPTGRYREAETLLACSGSDENGDRKPFMLSNKWDLMALLKFPPIDRNRC